MTSNTILGCTMKYITSFVFAVLLFSTCVNGDTTFDTVVKLDIQIKALNKDMNKKISLLEGLLDDKGKKFFRNEQNAWIDYMKAANHFAGDRYRGGTLSGVVELKAMSKALKSRIFQIDNYIDIYSSS